MEQNQLQFANDAERMAADIEQIHKLASKLLPFYSLITKDNTLEEPLINAQLQMLIGVLHELHPADVALVLESLPPKERVLVWKFGDSRRRRRRVARSVRMPCAKA